MGAILDDRRARFRRRAQREEREVALPLLHSINDDRCIGCEACIDVCPTEVLDLVDHKVRVARFSDCVQCEQCANACPTQALVMYREGTTPRMLTVAELDEHFQTGVPGQYLIGEVAGKPLVKNAANLGRAV
jgi:ferredoxin